MTYRPPLGVDGDKKVEGDNENLTRTSRDVGTLCQVRIAKIVGALDTI